MNLAEMRSWQKNITRTIAIFLILVFIGVTLHRYNILSNEGHRHALSVGIRVAFFDMFATMLEFISMAFVLWCATYIVVTGKIPLFALDYGYGVNLIVTLILITILATIHHYPISVQFL